MIFLKSYSLKNFDYLKKAVLREPDIKKRVVNLVKLATIAASGQTASNVINQKIRKPNEEINLKDEYVTLPIQSKNE